MPSDATIDSSENPSAVPGFVQVGVLASVADEGDAGSADFVAAAADIMSVDAANVLQALAEVEDVSSVLLHVQGTDAASIIAGQTLALDAGVRHLVADDVRSTRRVAVMMGQVLQAS